MCNTVLYICHLVAVYMSAHGITSCSLSDNVTVTYSYFNVPGSLCASRCVIAVIATAVPVCYFSISHHAACKLPTVR